MDFQMANAVELLKRVAEIYETNDLIMVMETMNPWNHPGFFLNNIPQAYSLIKSVDSPALKLLFDVYHVQLGGGNLISMLDYVWDEVAYIQIGDAPNRHEPGTGEINYAYLLQFIFDKGYRGFVGLEHSMSVPGKEGVIKAIKTYREIDPK